MTTRGVWLLATVAAATACSDTGTDPDPEQPSAVLAIVTEPPDTAQSSVVLAVQPVIQLQDSLGRNLARAGVTVGVRLTGGLAGDVTGTTAVDTDSTGRAVFTNVAIRGTVGVKRLYFEASGYAAASSLPVELVAGPPKKLVMTSQPPASTQTGALFSEQPAVQVTDLDGNAVAKKDVLVRVTVPDTAATLSGITSIRTFDDGEAVFPNLQLTAPVGLYQLRFSASGLEAVLSSQIEVAAGSPAGPGG